MRSILNSFITLLWMSLFVFIVSGENLQQRNRTAVRRNYQISNLNRGPRIQVKIGDRTYLRETLMIIDEIPLEMAFDDEGNLFFTKVDLSSDDPMVTVLMKKNTNRIRRVKGLKLGQGTAVDVDGTVYFASADGVYVYDKHENMAKPYALRGEDIFEIFIDSEGNKYVIHAGLFSVNLLNNDLTKVPFAKVPRADSISIDASKTIYYLHNGFVYMLRENSTHPIRIKELYKDSLSQISYDSKNNIYIAFGGGLLYAPAGTDDFVRVRKIYGGPTSIAFDSEDNFILGYRRKVYKFNLVRYNNENVTNY